MNNLHPYHDQCNFVMTKKPTNNTQNKYKNKIKEQLKQHLR